MSILRKQLSILKSPTPTPATLGDYAEAARHALDDAAWAFFEGGAADEITLRENIAAWQRLSLWPRVLRPLAGGHTRVTLAGRELAHPILLAPVAHQKLAHPDGEWASALAHSPSGCASF